MKKRRPSETPYTLSPCSDAGAVDRAGGKLLLEKVAVV